MSEAEHHANERTLLAWIRTSLGLVGMGLGFVKFGSKGNGYFFIILGVLYMGVSGARYFHVMKKIRGGLHGSSGAARASSIVVALSVTMLIIGYLSVELYHNYR